jgi:hypothetical protein
MEAEIEKMPENQRGFAKLALVLIDSMDMSLELKSGGEAEIKASLPSLDDKEAAKNETKKGKWKKEGDSVTISGADKDIKCTLEGSKLTCEADKPGQPKLVFIKG